MGLGLGFGLLLGVRTSTTGLFAPGLLLVSGLFVLALITRQRTRAILLLTAAGVLLGWAGGVWRTDAPDPTTIPELPETFEATILTDPFTTAAGTTVAVRTLPPAGPSEHEFRLYMPITSAAGRGDTVNVRARMSTEGPEPMLFTESLVVVQPAGWLERQRRTARAYSRAQMTEHVPGAPGSLILGLLIGDDSGLSAAERQDLRHSGLSHITAVSGWNVTVVVATVGALFAAVGARGVQWLAVQLGFLAGYVWLVGLEPPIQRAAIMGAVALVALHFGRPAHMLTLLILTAGVMVAWDPAGFSSLSFQLSFLSMVGLAVAARLTRTVTGWRAVIVSPVATAILAGVVTAPLLAATFGTFSPATIPANLLAGPLIPFATFAGMGVVAMSWVAPVAEVIGWAGWGLSTIVLGIARYLAGLPGAHFEFAPLPLSTTLTIYIVLLILIIPLFPEGRLLARRCENWFRSMPGPTVAGATIAVLLLATGAAFS